MIVSVGALVFDTVAADGVIEVAPMDTSKGLSEGKTEG